MCMMCGNPAHLYTLATRPAHRLVGRYWEGSYEEAAAGALHSLIGEMKELSARHERFWRSPIVGLSWNDRSDGFRYFCGFALDAPQLPEGLAALEVPETDYADIWHGPGDGDVIENYRTMMEWMADNRLSHDTSFCHQREEYAPDVDLSAPPSLRLMLPVIRPSNPVAAPGRFVSM
ncbi:MAG: GyrI-like domain-containing protein [Aliihoeflea sp.]